MLMNKDEQKTQAEGSRVRGYAKTLAVLGAIMLMLFFMSGMGRKLVQKEAEKPETTNAAAEVVPAAVQVFAAAPVVQAEFAAVAAFGQTLAQLSVQTYYLPAAAQSLAQQLPPTAL